MSNMHRQLIIAAMATVNEETHDTLVQSIAEAQPDNYLATLELDGKQCVYDGHNFTQLVEYPEGLLGKEGPPVIEATPELLEKATLVDESPEAKLENLAIIAYTTFQSMQSVAVMVRLYVINQGGNIMDGSEDLKEASKGLMTSIMDKDVDNAWLLNACISHASAITERPFEDVYKEVVELPKEELYAFIETTAAALGFGHKEPEGE